MLDIRQANLPLVSSTGAATAGTSSGTAMPSEVSIAVTLRTNRTGPGGRGRFYIPGWSNTALGAGDVVAPAAITAINNWLGNLGTAYAGAGLTQGLVLPARQAYTGSTGTSHPARTAQMLPVTGITVRDNHWDSQRRRGLK
jgi:hypothetical protein